MKFFVALFLLLLSTGCATHRPRPDQLQFPPLEFAFPAVENRQLANGMYVYVKENHELPLVDLTLMVEGGRIYDPPDKTGLSQLFAAVLETGGTELLPPEELEKELELEAMELSVSSSSYAYEISLSVHRDDLPRGLEILAQLVRRPGFAPARLELARQQLLESIRRRNDNPGAVAGRLLAEAVYPGHPFGSYPTQAAVSSLTRDDLIALHQRYFHPANFWLAVSGDIATAEMIRNLERAFSGWPPAESTVRDFPLPPPPEKGRVLLGDKDIPQTTILMGHAGISKDNPDLIAVRVANYILGGGGFNSRMMREVRSNRGLAYSVYSHFQIGRHLPELFIAASETKSQSTVEVVSLMRSLMEQLRKEPVSAAELEQAKQSIINSFVFAFENSHAVVTRRLRLDFYGYPADFMTTYRQKVSALTAADIRRVARLYLHPDQLQIVLVGDTAVFDGDIAGLGLPVERVDLN